MENNIYIEAALEEEKIRKEEARKAAEEKAVFMARGYSEILKEFPDAVLVGENKVEIQGVQLQIRNTAYHSPDSIYGVRPLGVPPPAPGQWFLRFNEDGEEVHDMLARNYVFFTKADLGKKLKNRAEALVGLKENFPSVIDQGNSFDFFMLNGVKFWSCKVGNQFTLSKSGYIGFPSEDKLNDYYEGINKPTKKKKWYQFWK